MKVFSSRIEMAKYYDDLMTRTQETRREVRRNRADENLIKTYLMELHSSERDFTSRDRLVDTLRRFGHECGAALVETDDWLFYGLVKGNTQFYIEVPDPRFVLLHTHVRAEMADGFISSAVNAAPFIDHAWIPSRSLTDLSRRGELRGFKLRSDDALSLRRGDPDRDQALRRLSLSLSLSENASETLEELRQVKAFRHAINVYGVEIRVGEGGSRRYALDEVFYDGKVTARGSSFTAHHDLTVDLCTKYAHKIRNIEDNFSVGLSHTDSGVSVEGMPFEVEFTPPLDDLDTFCSNLLSGHRPFRLWGVPEFLSEDYVAIRAVDLHGGHKLYFEISPELMRIYLPRHTCGNTVYRLFTGLQQHLSRSISVTHGGGSFDLDLG